jgi:ERCC4-type nuclease
MSKKRQKKNLSRADKGLTKYDAPLIIQYKKGFNALRNVSEATLKKMKDINAKNNTDT